MWLFHFILSIHWRGGGQEGALCTRACVCARLHHSFTHVADGGQFLSRVALFQQRPGVLGRIAAVVVHREFGAHEVGPDGEQIGGETPTNNAHLSESKNTELELLLKVKTVVGLMRLVFRRIVSFVSYNSNKIQT